MWDYNLPYEKIDDLLSGKIDRIGHYNAENLFVKMLESYPWFTIIDLLDSVQIKKLFTKDVIKKLKSPSLREKYFYVQSRLQEVVRDTRR